MYENEGPFFFFGIIHPPPSPELTNQLPEGYAFTLSELYKLAPKIQGVPVQVEHAGIHEAIDSTTAPDGQLAAREAVIAKLHDLGDSDATKSPVGTVLKAEVIQPSGALYALFQVFLYLVYPRIYSCIVDFTRTFFLAHLHSGCVCLL